MNTFNLNSRFQIASICFFLIIVFIYAKNKKLPLLSTKYFSVMFVSEGVYLLCDLASVYTISHMDTVPAWVNRTVHQFFFISLEMSVISLYLYVSILQKEQKRFHLKQVLLGMFPFVVSLIAVIFLPIYYENSEQGMYSYGPSVIVLYFALTYYILLTFAISFHNFMDKDRRTFLRAGLMLWAIALLFQIAAKQYLVSGLASVLMLLFVYLSFENPREHRDDETDTFNKRAFHLMISEMTAKQKTFFEMSIVVDELQLINKKFGHKAGLAFLKELAAYIQYVTDSRVYHSRGNTLSVLMSSDKNEVMRTAKSIKGTLCKDFFVERNNIRIKTHIDILECPKFAATPDEVADLMNYMSEQVKTSSETCCIRVVDENFIAQKKRYTTIEELVKDAIENDGFEIFYQPIYSTKEKKFASAEALVRLKDTQTVGFVSPEEFIPIAEKKELIIELGAIIFDKVCRFISEKKPEKYGVHYIEVNLSGIQSIDIALPAKMLAIMHKYQVPPEFINFEITETAAVESGEQLLLNMKKLRNMGSSFSMDDFGTGYSNLSQIAEVKYDLVKLDKSLIWPCFDNIGEKPCIILESIVCMILRLDVAIVAEGVETAEQAEKLTALGIEYLQGYHFSRPVNEENYILFLENSVNNNK